MIYNILIIGFGNIGYRHFESLNNSKFKLNIFIIDNDLKKFDKIKSLKLNHSTKTFRNFRNIKDNYYFLTIIATSARGRFNLLKVIKDEIRTKNLIIEKVLEQSKANLIKIKNLMINKKNCWVNSPYFSMNVFSDIKKKSKLCNTLTIKGGNWGLACNFFHFIILHNFLFNNNKIEEVLIDENCIWSKSKREDYQEIFGKVLIKYNNSNLILVSKKNLKTKWTLQIKDNQNTIRYTYGDNNFKINNKIIKSSGIILQSKLTNEYLTQLINNNSCKLPKLNESIKLHIPVIESLHKHWKHYTKSKSKTLPIT